MPARRSNRGDTERPVTRRPSHLQRVEEAMKAERDRSEAEFAQALDAWREHSAFASKQAASGR